MTFEEWYAKYFPPSGSSEQIERIARAAFEAGVLSGYKQGYDEGYDSGYDKARSIWDAQM